MPDTEDVGCNVEPDVNDSDLALSRVDVRKAYPARRYDYWLGGKDNFAADRRSGYEVEVVFPTIRLSTIENRRFLRRAVGFLIGAGVRQFLDIGSGMPTDSNTHEVAQAFAPESRVVYVDNDPIVVSHARVLLVSSPEGHTDYIEGDLHAPQGILRSPELRATLDMEQPIGLMMLALLHFSTTLMIPTDSSASWSPRCHPAATWSCHTGRMTRCRRTRLVGLRRSMPSRRCGGGPAAVMSSHGSSQACSWSTRASSRSGTGARPQALSRRPRRTS